MKAEGGSGWSEGKAWVPGAGRKPAQAVRGRKAILARTFMHQASSLDYKKLSSRLSREGELASMEQYSH